MSAQTVQTKTRVWEIDAIRGFLILCVLVAHTLYCGENMFGMFRLPAFLNTFLFTYAGSVFVILSGLSATLGSRSFRRGVLVFLCGMVLTLGSAVGVWLGLLTEDFIIRFGVLHLLGLCMILYPLLKRMPDLTLLLFGLAVIGLGYWFTTFHVEVDFLFALGLTKRGFTSGDFFPVFPQLGWFCIGILAGRGLYAEKKTRLPQIDPDVWFLRALRFLGRHTLPIFLVHLPIIGGVMYLIQLVLK